MDKKETSIAYRISTVSIFVNLFLTIIKLIAGIVGHSGAMISDAIHSATDVFSTFIVMIGIHYSKREKDKDHQYGHERMECVAAIILATLLGYIGIEIGWEGIKKIIYPENLIVPEKIALFSALLSILVKEWMFWYTRSGAKKINSSALMADAWHHRSDSLSSVGAFIGIYGAQLGYPILDPIATVLISFCILFATYEIFKDAIDKMVDKSCDIETEQQIKNLVLKQQGVLAVDLLSTRLFGAKIYVDLEISANGSMSLYEAHEIANKVHDEIESKFLMVKHCMVHVNPR
ncbi:MAG: cation diffusion facilitator family transporter [Alphaproteobacteria bacterium]|nr:cation diffusion facilitator family transporter [Alphaproteobacteria bacterium]